MGMTATLLRYYSAAHSREEKNKVVSTALLFVTATGILMLEPALRQSSRVARTCPAKGGRVVTVLRSNQSEAEPA